MFIYTKQNVVEDNSKVYFLRVIDVIKCVMKNDGYIFGSFVYGYIWLCDIYCLEWDKYSSIEYIVNAGNNNLFFTDIDMIFESSFESNCFFMYAKNHFENDLPIENVHNSQYGVNHMTLKFNDPFGNNEATIKIDITNYEYINKIAKPDFSVTNTKWNNSRGFSLLYKNEAVVNWLSKNVGKPININNITQQSIAFKIIRQSILDLTTECLMSGSAEYQVADYIKLWERIYKINQKGYRVTWQNQGIQIIVVAPVPVPVPDDSKVSEQICSICMDSLNKCEDTFGKRCKITLGCHATHAFHGTCIAKWANKNHMSCPLCRTKFCQNIVKGILFDCQTDIAENIQYVSIPQFGDFFMNIDFSESSMTTIRSFDRYYNEIMNNVGSD